MFLDVSCLLWWMKLDLSIYSCFWMSICRINTKLQTGDSRELSVRKIPDPWNERTVEDNSIDLSTEHSVAYCKHGYVQLYSMQNSYVQLSQVCRIYYYCMLPGSVLHCASELLGSAEGSVASREQVILILKIPIIHSSISISENELNCKLDQIIHALTSTSITFSGDLKKCHSLLRPHSTSVVSVLMYISSHYMSHLNSPFTLYSIMRSHWPVSRAEGRFDALMWRCYAFSKATVHVRPACAWACAALLTYCTFYTYNNAERAITRSGRMRHMHNGRRTPWLVRKFLVADCRLKLMGDIQTICLRNKHTNKWHMLS